MFRDLSKKTIPGILDYQSAVLTEYQLLTAEPNIAIELPTGGGKSLVGTLIAEWRRRLNRERCVYLCPTVQLANQTASYARTKYGIDAALLTGAIKSYAPSQRNAYQTGAGIAISTYSSLFNTNPFFNDAHVLIFDDAHASETYIGNLWNVSVDRSEHAVAFEALAALISPLLTPSALASFNADDEQAWDRAWVQLLPLQRWYPYINEVIGVLDAYAAGTNMSYPWSMIKQSLAACQIYLGPNVISIRPVIPPTQSFPPFADAKQRIFMSATLGDSGDLERSTGISSFARIRPPEAMLKLGVGRRFFIFPGRAQDDENPTEIEKSLIQRVDRALVLLPSNKLAEKEKEALESLSGFEIFGIKDLEQSKELFVASPAAIAVLAGRYDGLDFPDEECRLLIIRGLPGALELQERYLRNKASAGEFLELRVRNRIVQAVGRCTRNENDYSAIVVLEDDLLKYFQHTESRELLPLELQAEILFGLEQSENESKNLMGQQLDVFLQHGDEWEEAESEIRGLRVDTRRGSLSYADTLASASESEVEWQSALWSGSFSKAYEHARTVVEALDHDSLKGYRAFWNYLAGTSAFLASENSEPLGAQATAHFRSAGSVIPDLDVVVRASGVSAITAGSERDKRALQFQVEGIESRLAALGISGNKKFNAYEKGIRERISASDSKVFEGGLVDLGAFLGYRAGKVEEDATPDPWWVIDDDLILVFEAHSKATSSVLGARKAREAAGHVKWIRRKVGTQSTEVIPVLLSNARPSTEGASIQLESVSVWDLDDFRVWANSALVTIRDLRRTCPGRGNLVWRSAASDMLIAKGLDAASLIRKVRDLSWEPQR
jgi:hypothetical protein